MSNSLWSRLRQARLVRVIAIYLAACWVVLQVTDLFVDNFGLPAWFMPAALVLLIVGFVVLLATAWIQSHPETSRREAAEEVPSDWELELKDLGRSISRGKMPHLTWARAILGGGAAFLLFFGLAGIYIVIKDRGASFAPGDALAEAAPGIAVLPFEVSGPDLDVWREGVVDLVSTNIDGVAGLRAIDSRTVLARWGERVTVGATPDLDTSLDIARRAGARYAVLGNAAALGPTVRLTADVYDVESGRSLGRAMVEGAPDSVYMLIDRLSMEVLRAVLGEAEDLPHVDLARVTTTSLPALRAYLAGEVLFRRADFESAIPEYQRAVEADSTFALANYRLAQAYGWSQSIGAEPAIQASDRAARFADRLPEREAIVVRADHTLAHGTLEGLEPLRQAVLKYPDDPELWYVLADTYNHFGDRALAPAEEETRAWERLLQLAPDFAPYYIHPIENAVLADDSTRFAELLPRYLQLAPDSRLAQRFTLLRDLLWGSPAERRVARAAIDTLTDGRMARSVVSFLWAPRVLPLGAELSAEIRRRPDAIPSLAMSIHWRAMARGKLTEAVAALDDPLIPTGFRLSRLHDLRTLGFAVDPARIDRAMTEVYADTAASPAGYLAAGAWGVDRGRPEEVERTRSRLREQSARFLAAGDSVEAGSLNGTIVALDGYAAWRRGRREEALALFERAQREIVGLGFIGTPHGVVRWWTAELLVEMDRPADAARYYEAFDEPDPYSALRLGRIYEGLGERDKAREEYEEVLAVFVEPDAELRPMVAEARQGLARLGFRPRG